MKVSPIKLKKIDPSKIKPKKTPAEKSTNPVDESTEESKFKP